jgi:hypothetical protein
MLKDRLDRNLAQDFARFELFHSESFVVEFFLICSDKIIRVSRASEFVFARAMNFK